MSNKKLSRRRLTRSMIYANCLLVGWLLIGLSGSGRSSLRVAQAQEGQEFRVGNLIESGNFGDPKGWKLDGFRVEGNNISRKGQDGPVGTAATTFKGPDGFYKIRIKYYDEGDGASQAALAIGGREVGSWRFDGILVNAFRWKEFDNVPIKKGDEIVLSGRKHSSEYCRIYGIEILPSLAPKKVEPDAVASTDYSKHLIPLSGHLAGQLSTKYVVRPKPIFRGGDGTYLIYLTEGQRFRLTTWPNFSRLNTSLDYTLTKAGAAEPLAAETLVSESTQPILLRLRGREEGLYELKVKSAPGSKGKVNVDFDVPGVSAVPASGEGYFFVPAGTKAFSVRTKGHCVLLDASGTVMLDEMFDKTTTPVIEVPAGSDNQVWYFQGSLSRLEGVPPYVSARPDALLAPAETLK